MEVRPDSVEEKRFGESAARPLAHGLLLGQERRPVGRVGVQPAAPMGKITYRKKLKNKGL
jgi:hypothetical protein